MDFVAAWLNGRTKWGQAGDRFLEFREGMAAWDDYASSFLPRLRRAAPESTVLALSASTRTRCTTYLEMSSNFRCTYDKQFLSVTISTQQPINLPTSRLPNANTNGSRNGRSLLTTTGIPTGTTRAPVFLSTRTLTTSKKLGPVVLSPRPRTPP